MGQKHSGGGVYRGNLASLPASKVWGKHRAVVLNTYAPTRLKTPADVLPTPELPPELAYSDKNVSGYQVECDVVLVNRMIQIPRVPVCQPEHGLNNATTWVPRQSTRDVERPDAALSLAREDKLPAAGQIAPTTPLDRFDGDNVLVEFVEGDKDFPIIVGPWFHPKAKRVVTEGQGWAESEVTSSQGVPHSDEKYLNHFGMEVRINKSGGVLIDTTGAWIDASTGEGDADNETVPPNLPDPAPQGGPVRVRLKPLARFTIESGGTDILEVYTDVLGQVHIDLGEGATENVVRGKRLVAWLAAHVHGTGVGTTSVPVPVAGGETIDVVTGLATFLSRLHKVENSSDGLIP